MEKNEGGQLVRALGLKESISMTIGTVVGVGLFTCGSSQIGYVGSGIIVITFLSLLISIWPCLIYGEMSAALPCAGGTYNYAKRGLNRVWANLAGWHYIISVVGIGAGETLAFSNYFKILFGELGINIEGVDSRIIAIVLVLFFLILNFRGIEMSGKAQTGFIFFFWGCAVAWFLYMIPRIHLDYFGGIAMDSLPPFKEMMYIFGLVWWCYTGFETCVSMGAETKYPQYTLPRALKVSVFLVFAVNALFQWFLVGLVPHEFYHILAVADAPYAEGLRAAGLVGFPIILLCIGIAFGGDLSTINPGIAAPARYIYTMAEDGSLPKFLCKVHPKYKTPINSLYLIGLLSCLAPLAGRKMLVWVCDAGNFGCCLAYCMVSLSFLILRKKEPDMPRPYKVGPYKFVGTMAVLMSAFMILMYMIPGSGATLVWQEWAMAGGWCVLGGVFFVVCKLKYKEEFGSLVEIISDEDAAALQSSDEEINAALDAAIDAAINSVLEREYIGSLL